MGNPDLTVKIDMRDKLPNDFGDKLTGEVKLAVLRSWSGCGGTWPKEGLLAEVRVSKNIEYCTDAQCRGCDLPVRM